MAAQTLTTTVTPGPQCAHCLRHLLHDIAYVECAFPLCDRLPLCIDCFVVGACAVAPHRTNHPYRVVEKLALPVYTPEWSAQEETRLLQACLTFGLNQWKKVADYVCTKTPYKCEMHYNDVYLHSKTAPLPSDEALTAPQQIQEETVVVHAAPSSPAVQNGHATFPVASSLVTSKGKSKGKGRGRPKGKQKSTPKGKRVTPTEHDPAASAHSIAAPSPGQVHNSPKDGRSLLKKNDDPDHPNRPAEGALQGFTWQRQDFDVEFDDQAETLIADLAIAEDDDDEVVALKSRLLEIYDHRLQVREAVKKIIFDRNLLDFSNLKAVDRRHTRDEKELSARLHVFRRILDPLTFSAFYDSVMFEYRLAKDMYLHASGKENGLRTKAEIDIYEIDARRRAAELGSIDRKERDAADKKTLGRTKATPSPALVFAETRLQGIDPGQNRVSTPSTPAMNTNGTPAGSTEKGSPVGVAASPYATPGSPKESKTARLRRSREAKVLARSKYPQVSAMRVDREEGVSALTEPEKTLCSALRMLPMDFLKQRDAMLRVSEQLLSEKERMEQSKNVSSNVPEFALRAGAFSSTVCKSGGESVETVAIASVPVNAGLTVTTSITRTGTREDHIISGSRHQVKLLNVTPNSDGVGRVCHATLPAESTVAQVEIKRHEAMSQEIQMHLTYCGAPEFNREEKKQEEEIETNFPCVKVEEKLRKELGDGVALSRPHSTTVRLLLKPPQVEKSVARKLDVSNFTTTHLPSSTGDALNQGEHRLDGGSAQLSAAMKETKLGYNGAIATPARKRGRRPSNIRRSSRRLVDEKIWTKNETVEAVIATNTQSLQEEKTVLEGTRSGTAPTAPHEKNKDDEVEEVIPTIDGQGDRTGRHVSTLRSRDLTAQLHRNLDDDDAVHVPKLEVTEEILDGGDGNDVAKQGSEKIASAVEVIEIASTSGEPEVPAKPRRGRPRKSAKAQRGSQVSKVADSPVMRSPRHRRGASGRKVSVVSDGEGLRPGGLRLRLNLASSEAESSEKSSVPSTPVAEDDQDKDYELEETSEDQDTPSRAEPRRPESQDVLFTPTRKSSRLSERLREVEKPVVAVSPSRSPRSPEKETKASPRVEVSGLSTPEQPVKRKRGRPRKYPIGQSPSARAASGRKPPVTPHTGKKRDRARLSEIGQNRPSKTRRVSTNVYELRRRR